MKSVYTLLEKYVYIYMTKVNMQFQRVHWPFESELLGLFEIY